LEERMSKGKALLSIVLVLTLQAAVAGAQYCRNVVGDCYALGQFTGTTCGSGYTNGATPCPTATPVPTITPTATPTPKAEVQPTYTITDLFRADALGYSYVQWMSLMNNVLWGNGGVCCPGIGDGIGECPFLIDYNVSPPAFREIWCTYRDSTQLWETGLLQVASSDEHKWVVTGVRTHRPAVPALQDAFKMGEVWGLGTNNLEQVGGVSWQKTKTTGVTFSMQDWLVFPQGILDLGGTRWLYASVGIRGEPRGQLIRLVWPGAYRTAQWDFSSYLSKADPAGYNTPITNNWPGLNGIVIDTDGSLIGTDNDWASGNAYGGRFVRLWRSKDEGRTWADTGVKFNARAGKTLFMCGFAHKSGGAALVPWHLICVEGTGKGPDQKPSDWNTVSVRVTGAVVPPNFGQKPTFKP
jgi:hypothetical protein